LLTGMSWSHFRYTLWFGMQCAAYNLLLDSFSSRYYCVLHGLLTSFFPRLSSSWTELLLIHRFLWVGRLVGPVRAVLFAQKMINRWHWREKKSSDFFSINSFFVLYDFFSVLSGVNFI
jgi:hypothetical protein